MNLVLQCVGLESPLRSSLHGVSRSKCFPSHERFFLALPDFEKADKFLHRVPYVAQGKRTYTRAFESAIEIEHSINLFFDHKPSHKV